MCPQKGQPLSMGFNSNDKMQWYMSMLWGKFSFQSKCNVLATYCINTNKEAHQNVRRL